MNKFRFTINVLAVAIFMFAFASFAQAQATRTWVSGVGDDVNPCSRTAPCKTFAGAISKTAAGGEIDCLDPGGFGAVTATKSITFDGTGTFGSILASATTGINVNDSATGTPNTIKVRVRGLSINGAGTTLGINGINFSSGASLSVEDSVIDSFSSNGITVTAAAAVSNLVLRNVVIRNCATGVNINPTLANATVMMFDNVNITRSSSNDLNVLNGGRGQINNCFFGSAASGINATQAGSPTTFSINDSAITANTNGITVQNSARVAIARVVITGNGNAFGLSGGFIDTGLNNTIMNNGTNQAPNGNPFPQQ